MNIEIISGSPRQSSITVRVAQHLMQRLQAVEDCQVGFIDMRIHVMPTLEKVFTSPEAAPEKYQAVAQRVFEADAFVLVTPEYNGSYTPELKNFLDHFPKQTHKVFGIVTASTGALGGMRAALHLQHLVFALFGIGSPFMLLVPEADKRFDADGTLLDAAFEKNIDLFIKEFLWLSRHISQKVESL